MGITEKIFTEIMYCSVLDISQTCIGKHQEQNWIISCFYAEVVPVHTY